MENKHSVDATGAQMKIHLIDIFVQTNTPNQFLESDIEIISSENEWYDEYTK